MVGGALIKNNTGKNVEYSELMGEVVVDRLVTMKVVSVHDIIESLHNVMEITENQSRRENCKVLINILARKLH